MIYLPEIYPDELVYSWLARYYVKTGYIRHSFISEELFECKTTKPSIEFINQYAPNVYQDIIKKISMEELIEKHTMFPYYGRFLPLKKRIKAFKSLKRMNTNINNLLPIPKKKDNTKRYLKYCPICVENDRKKYGETYWHRIHQLRGIAICSKHKCYLIDSKIEIINKRVPLIASEIAIPIKNNCFICENNIEIKIADYNEKVFHSKLDFQSEVTIGKFLHFKMENTPYRSIRGEQRNILLLHTQFKNYYKNLPNNNFSELWQIQKVLTDDRINFNEICMLAMFLNISPNELTNMKISQISQEQKFDKQIFELRKQGLKYTEIAKKLGASYDTVKAIGERKYSKYHNQEYSNKSLKSGAKAYNWDKIDDDTFPLVKKAIEQIQKSNESKPKKITVFAIEKLLGLPSKRISQYLPKCRIEIEKYYETQEEYWAREVAWAIGMIVEKGDVLNWTHIRDLTNMRKQNFIKCFPYLVKYTDETTIENLKVLL